MTAAAAPLSPAALAGRLQALSAPKRLLIAVSGGRDSMALVGLAVAAGGRELFAATVDHGLRPGARAEAEQAGEWCRAQGVPHTILSWTGDKPSSGVQEAARAARYRLLAGYAAAMGCSAILTAHTADDQAETVFMRLSRGAGADGLAAMAAETAIAAGAGPVVRLLRPLLDVGRENLEAVLGGAGQAWIDDPSNDDPAYERVRTRALLAALYEQNILTREALLRTAVRADRAAQAMTAQAFAAFDASGGVLHGGGWASLARDDAAGIALALRGLIRAVSGGDHPPGEAETEAALAQCREAGAASLGGALVKRWKGRLFVLREPAALLGRVGVAPAAPLALAPGESALWDGRFIARNHGSERALTAALGHAGVTALGPRRGLHDAPDEALASAPAGLFEDGSKNRGVRFIPLLDERFRTATIRFS